MNRLRKAVFLAVCIAICCCRTAVAWNDVGHLIIARIAWERLNDSERSKIVTLLRQHPHRTQVLMKYRPEAATEAEWLFMRAAIWSDHIRPPRDLTETEIAAHPIHKFHRSTWHYVNYPYRAGQPESSLPTHIVQDGDHHSTNLLEQLTLSTKVLLGEVAHDPDQIVGLTEHQNKAVRLCWLFHLLGDLHQPLHTTTLVDSVKFPTGHHTDHGGNGIAIRTHVGGPAYKLHAFWDDRLGTDSHYPTVVALAEVLSHDPRLAPDQLPELSQHRDFKSWAAESYQGCKTNVYLEGHLPFALWDDYEHHRITVDEIPVLPQGIESKANRLARRRVALAGYRLAEILKRIAGS